MIRRFLAMFGLAALLFAQDKPTVAPGTVVAVVNGKKMTAEDITKMFGGLPPKIQQAFKNDPQQFLKEYAWYVNLVAQAEKDGLPNKSPYKEILEFNRILTLVQAAHDTAYLDVSVSAEQQKKFYDDNQNRYRETQAKLIYLPLSVGVAEEEVKAKAEKIVQQARGGVDFVKLVKEFSQDSASAAQNGDMGISIRSTTTQIPEVVRNAILALKPGQISEPLRLENGYYVFRAESAGVLPYEKVKDEIYKELKDVGFRQWMTKTQAQSSVQFENEAFFQNIKQQETQQTPAGNK